VARNEQPRCLIAAGGTGGHVLPALAVAEALRERGAIVTFAGSQERIEARLVPEAGFSFDPLPVSGLPRRLGWPLARALARAGAAPARAARIVRERKPDVVCASGYVGGPVVLAAFALRIPCTLLEVDAHLGLANRLAAPFARRVFLSFPIEGRTGPKYRVTGRPIPARSRPLPAAQARARFGLPPSGRVLLVFGGSQGARSLNELAVESFGREGPAVLHLCGERDHALLVGRVERDDYLLVPFTNDVGAALSSADLVLARGGGSLWEIAGAGRPAVVVPYPWATGDHQAKNARYFEQAGGIVVVAEADLPRAAGLVRELLADEARLARMAEAMRSLARADAAEEIAEELVALAAA
jgi:UDP-N-acetylglucosamine--N-acetylmuramyl-(pentapeptide) pyrophosphoryl-undecaprenol N-acetylglucosamine transferase